MIVANENKNYRVIAKSENIRELREEIENLVWDYVFKHSIIEKKYFKKSRSHKWGNVPYGYFVVSQNNKLTVYNKFVRTGILYNSTIVEKAISLVLIEPEKKQFTPLIKDSEYVAISEQKIDDFEHIHRAILEKQRQSQLLDSDRGNL